MVAAMMLPRLTIVLANEAQVFITQMSRSSTVTMLLELGILARRNDCFRSLLLKHLVAVAGIVSAVG